MTKIQVKRMVDYWEKTAQRDYDTMKILFRNKRYPESLFYGHIVLEKVLKAYVVRRTKEQSPRIHDLVRLAEVAGITLQRETIELLKEVNNFNIRARYPDYKLKFYKYWNKKLIAEQKYNEITNLYKHLCNQL